MDSDDEKDFEKYFKIVEAYFCKDCKYLTVNRHEMKKHIDKVHPEHRGHEQYTKLFEQLGIKDEKKYLFLLLFHSFHFHFFIFLTDRLERLLRSNGNFSDVFQVPRLLSL